MSSANQAPVTGRFSLLGVPSAAGTHGPGQEKAPQALRNAALTQRLQERGAVVDDHGDLPIVPFTPDPRNRRHQNADRVIEVVRMVTEGVGALLGGEGVPLIIGGDCTITLGVVAAYVSRHPDLGLMYFDGDIDVSTPADTTSGILDTMGMAHLLGHGLPELAAVGPRRPLLAGDRIAAFGYDEREPSAAQREWLAVQGVRCYPANRMSDAEDQAACAWAELAQRSGPILVHFDVDVIDSTDLPLANFPHFNEGLSHDDAMVALRVFCSQEAFAGLVITEINPDRDVDGTLVARLAGDLATALI